MLEDEVNKTAVAFRRLELPSKRVGQAVKFCVLSFYLSCCGYKGNNFQIFNEISRSMAANESVEANFLSFTVYKTCKFVPWFPLESFLLSGDIVQVEVCSQKYPVHQLKGFGQLPRLKCKFILMWQYLIHYSYHDDLLLLLYLGFCLSLSSFYSFRKSLLLT